MKNILLNNFMQKKNLWFEIETLLDVRLARNQS